MFSTDFIFRQQENLVDNQKCQAGFRLLCNKVLLSSHFWFSNGSISTMLRVANVMFFWEKNAHAILFFESRRRWKFIQSQFVSWSIQVKS